MAKCEVCNGRAVMSVRSIIGSKTNYDTCIPCLQKDAQPWRECMLELTLNSPDPLSRIDEEDLEILTYDKQSLEFVTLRQAYERLRETRKKEHDEYF